MLLDDTDKSIGPFYVAGAGECQRVGLMDTLLFKCSNDRSCRPAPGNPCKDLCLCTERLLFNGCRCMKRLAIPDARKRCGEHTMLE